MTVTLSQVRPGAYYDSVVLMQLQSSLAKLKGVVDAGVVMATQANLDLLASSDLMVEGDVGPDDLLIVVRAEDNESGQTALRAVDDLLKKRISNVASEFRPRSLQAAARALPDAGCVLISVPGRYAAEVARDALALDKHVFLYSDNVSIEDELDLKNRAKEKGLIVMGPDCGTAIISGLGLGFANRIRQGPVGLLGASGTGMQAISSRIHQLGSGISQAIGTGGRDLKQDVKGITTLQGLSLLADDDETYVIVLVSKPPAPDVAAHVISSARSVVKPVVICFLGQPAAFPKVDNIYFSWNLEDAADQAISLLVEGFRQPDIPPSSELQKRTKSGYVRGLFSGGTLAYEVVLGLQSFLFPIYTNASLYESQRLQDVNQSVGHTILDMGEDVFTQGRLHPMMNNDLRIRRMLKEAADPEVGVILFDVVLGEGAHPDPATELAEGVNRSKQVAREVGTVPEFMALILGTDEDPQIMSEQEFILRKAGVAVVHTTHEIIEKIAQATSAAGSSMLPEVDSSLLRAPLKLINVGLEVFTDSLESQGAEVLHVDWKPPAGGNEELMSILSKMRSKS